MSSQRPIKDDTWTDEWFFDLDPTEKLVWVFLLTNPRMNIAGLYKMSIRWGAIHTGLDPKPFEVILGRFINDGKIVYEDGWVAIQNFKKHLPYQNPSVSKGIQRILESVTDCPQSVYSVGQTLLNLTLPNGECKPSSLNGKKENKTMSWNKTSDDAADEVIVDYDSGEEIKPAAKKPAVNATIIGLLKDFKDRSEQNTGVRPAETKGEYFALQKAMKTHQLELADVHNLYDYFFADAKLKPEQHSSLGLCISGAYITQWRINQKRKPVSQAEAAAQIKL